jgi:hypothetical protein
MAGSQRNPDTPRFSIRGLLIFTVLVAVFAAGASALMRIDARLRAEKARVAKMNAQTRAKIVKEIDAIRARLGRAPENERELVRLMGGSMPEVDVLGHPVSIEYDRTGTNSYKLHHWELSNGDWYECDSSVPQAGWTAIHDWFEVRNFRLV